MPSPHDQGPAARPQGRDDGGSLSLEVIGELEVSNTLAHLEARLESLELDLARSAGAREEESRRVSSEIQLMRARLQDGLGAITETAEELRQAWVSLDKRLADRIETRLAEHEARLAEERGERAGAAEVARHLLEESEARIRGEIEAIRAADLDRAAALGERIDRVEARLDAAAAQLRDAVAEAGARLERATGERADLEGRIGEALAAARLEAGRVRDEVLAAFSEERARAEERARELERRLESLGASVESLVGHVQDLEARRSAERASSDAAIQSVASEVTALQGRVRNTLERGGGPREPRLAAVEADVEELRRSLLRLVEAMSGAAVASRRLSDLELRVADMSTRLARERQS